MASSSKKKTTMAKIMREQAVPRAPASQAGQEGARKLEAATQPAEPVDATTAPGAEVSAAER